MGKIIKTILFLLSFFQFSFLFTLFYSSFSFSDVTVDLSEVIYYSYYDKKDNVIYIEYNAQTDFSPSRVISRIHEYHHFNSKAVNINVNFFLYDCKLRTDYKYGSFWDDIFYPSTKAEYLKNCNQDVQSIKDMVKYVIFESNQMSLRLTQLIEREKAKEEELSIYRKDIKYFKELDQKLDMLSNSIEDLQKNETASQKFIINIKEYILKNPYQSISELIQHFREKIKKDSQYSNKEITVFLNQLENIFNSMQERDLQLEVDLETWFNEIHPLDEKNLITFSKEEEDTLRKLLRILYDFSDPMESIGELTFQLAYHLQSQVDPSYQNKMPVYFKEWLVRLLFNTDDEEDNRFLRVLFKNSISSFKKKRSQIRKNFFKALITQVFILGPFNPNNVFRYSPLPSPEDFIYMEY